MTTLEIQAAPTVEVAREHKRLAGRSMTPGRRDREIGNDVENLHNELLTRAVKAAAEMGISVRRIVR